MDFGLAQKAPVPLKKTKSGSRLALAQVPSGSHLSPTTTTSPRKSKRNQEEATRTSPRKRKRTEDTENLPESPRKRKTNLEAEAAALGELDLNTTDVEKKDKTQEEKDQRKSLTPTPAEMFQGAYNKTKSPRRMLLTKRALDLSRGGAMLNKGNSIGARTVVVQQAGRSMYKSVSPSACQCFGQPMVCNVCVSR